MMNRSGQGPIGRRGMAGHFILGNDGYAAGIGKGHQVLEFLDRVGLAAVLVLFGQLRVGLRREHERLVVGQVQLQVADLVEAAKPDNLLQRGNRMILPGDVDQQPAIGDRRLVGHGDRRQEGGIALPLDCLKKRCRTHGHRGVISAPDRGEAGDLDRIRLALELRVDLQHDVAGDRFSHGGARSLPADQHDFFSQHFGQRFQRPGGRDDPALRAEGHPSAGGSRDRLRPRNQVQAGEWRLDRGRFAPQGHPATSPRASQRDGDR